ncbi:MAG TPA: nucleoside deaminase [Opitutales bacterium]|nr:nucleoside deaminase [Opitutales bacterium]
MSEFSDKSVPACPFEKRHPSFLALDDAYFMALAYNLAIDAWNLGEVPVGAVIEYGGEVVAKAHNCVESSGDPTAHAEILALTSACRAIGDWRMTGATLYVTKEPCSMCSGAMVMSRMTRVVYAVPDPKMGCLGGAADVNALPGSFHRVQVQAGGVMESECRELIQAFFRLRREAAQD